MSSSSINNMTTGTPWKLILRFSLPLLIGNLLQQAYNIVDSIVVGRFVGTTALAAVGTAFPVIFLLLSLFIGLGVGSTIIISQYYGANNRESVKKTIDTTYITMFAVGIPLSIVGILLSEPLLVLMNTPADVLPQATTYMRIIFAGTLASFGYNINSGILQGLGDSRSPLLYLLIATVFNIVLDLLFVGVFGWGVAGVAWATIIAQIIAFVFGIWHINRTQTYIHISWRNMQPNKRLLMDSIRLGLPAGLQNMSFSVGTMVLQSLINSYGSVFMAGFNGANKIDAIAFMPMMTFSSAITTYVGQNIGAGRMDRVRQGLRWTLIMSSIVCAVICPLILIFGSSLMQMFDTNPDVIQAGLSYLIRVVPFFILLSIMFIYTGALRGAGEAAIPLITAIVSLWFARVPLAYLLATTGRDNMFFSFVLGWIVGCLIIIPYYYSGRWKKKAVVRISNEEQVTGNE
jgi:putative MATE family efflux protein